MPTVLILAGPTFTVPADFVSLTKVEAIGAGNEGSNFNYYTANPSGGGAYAMRNAIAGIGPGSVYSLQIGQSAGGDGPGTAPTANTWFKDAATLVAAGASPMVGATVGIGAGGQDYNCVGDVAFSGGNGGPGNTGDAIGGGGGAAGPNGPGVTPGAAVPSVGAPGGAGDAGFGGAGGAIGANGGDGTEIGAGAGSGGGAGGGAGGYFFSGTGGKYGGGASGNGYPYHSFQPGGQGAIWFKYAGAPTSKPEWLIRARRRGRR